METQRINTDQAIDIRKKSAKGDMSRGRKREVRERKKYTLKARKMQKAEEINYKKCDINITRKVYNPIQEPVQQPLLGFRIAE